MKAYVTSIGERTTDLCCWQLKRMGFNVVRLDKVEPWVDKYRRFIEMADKEGRHCLRVDADIIPNMLLKEVAKGFLESPSWLLVQFHTYGMYRNNVGITCPVIYHKNALAIIADNLEKLDPARPETSAWRLPMINGDTFTSRSVVGIHGLLQDDETIDRAKQNKVARGQDHLYDWEFVEKLRELYSHEYQY